MRRRNSNLADNSAVLDQIDQDSSSGRSQDVKSYRQLKDLGKRYCLLQSFSSYISFSSFSTYYLTRILFLRFLGLLFFTAFNVALFQNIALLGDTSGLIPACKVAGFSTKFSFTWNTQSRSLFISRPSLFWFIGCNDEVLTGTALVGLFISFIPLIFGVCNIVLLATLWLCYASFVNLGSTWYSFGWETQLLETSIWSIFILSFFSLRRINPILEQSQFLVSYIYKILIAKIMIGAGMIKIRGDDCWRDIFGKNCMLYHYETQPNPHILSPFFHHLPHFLHSIETLSNHFIELLVPILLLPFLPRLCRILAGIIFVFFQLVLISTGNLAFLNWLTIIPALYCFDDKFLSPFFSTAVNEEVKKASVESNKMTLFLTNTLSCHLQRNSKRRDSQDTQEYKEYRQISIWKSFSLLFRSLFSLLGLVYYMSLQEPVVKNLLSQQQAMNRSFDQWHISNTYGAFGSIGKVRTEVIYSGKGTDDNDNDNDIWKEFEFYCKPGALSKRPCVITPYHLRLDWSAWFSAMASYQHYPWTVHFVQKMLEPRKTRHKIKTHNKFSLINYLRNNLSLPIAIDVRDLILYSPFTSSTPPRMIKALLYEYRFTPSIMSSLLVNTLSTTSKINNASIDIGNQLCTMLPSSWEWLKKSPHHPLKCIANRKLSDGLGGTYFEVKQTDGTLLFEIGIWYTRRYLQEYIPPIERNNPSVKEFLKVNGLAHS
jgi:lipase maturation factor 1